MGKTVNATCRRFDSPAPHTATYNNTFVYRISLRSVGGLKMCAKPLDLLRLEPEVVLSVIHNEGLWLNANLLLTGNPVVGRKN
jgi:hypothetical protein